MQTVESGSELRDYSKEYGRKKLLRRFMVVFILLMVVVGLVVGYFRWMKSRSSDLSKLNKYDIDISNLVVVEPWDGEGGEEKPELPNADSLWVKYVDYQRAIDERDFELFKQLSSSMRLWYFGHNLELIGMNETKHEVFRATSGDPKAAFEKYAPAWTGIYTLPENMSATTPVDVRWVEPDETASDIQDYNVIVDEETNSTYLLKSEEWDYAAMLEIKVGDLNGNGLQRGPKDFDIEVLFVYEDGDWRVHREESNLVCANGYVFGDGLLVGKNVEVYSEDEGVGGWSGAYPKEIVVNAGEVVVWENLYGVISSMNGEPWNSSALRGHAYAKKFDEPGVYEYYIWLYDSTQNFEGKVVVK